MIKSSLRSIFNCGILMLIIGISGCGEKKTEKTSVPKPPLKTELQSLQLKEKSVSEPVFVTEKTRKTYQWYCAQCHGIEGKGNGVNAKFLTVPPRDHTKAAYLETRTDEQFFEAIKFGGSSLKDYVSTDGTLGNFQNQFKVYNREGKKIRGYAIKRAVQYGRSTFYCSKIQKK